MKQIELLIDGGQIDLFDTNDVPIKLNYFLTDLEFLSKRGGVVSNIFKVPATRENSIKLNRYHDIQTKDYEKFTEDREAILMAGGVKILDGSANGKSAGIRKLPEYFELNLKGDNLIWSTLLEKKAIVDLNLPTVNYDAATVKAAWTNVYTDKYFAPMVAYGRPWNYNIAWDPSAGTGGAWTAQHLGGNPLKWIWQDFRYWLFVQPMIIDMFNSIGFTVNSNFINSAEFKKFGAYFDDKNFWITEAEGTAGVVDFKKDVIKEERNCLDFLKGICNRFNLFFQTDIDRKVVTIEPFNDLFSSLEAIDQKIDYSQVSTFKQFTDKQQNIVFADKSDFFGDFIQSDYNTSERLKLAMNRMVINGAVTPEVFYFGEGWYKGGILINRTFDNKTVENYFTSYPTVQLQLDNLGAPYTTMYVPCIASNPATIESHVISGILPGIDYILQLPGVAQQTEPRFGYFAGMQPMKDGTDHSAIGNKFIYESDAAISDRPLLYICDYGNEENGNNYHYSDQWNSAYWASFVLGGVTPPFTVTKMPGLISKHYSNLIYSIATGRLAEVPLMLKPTDFLNRLYENRVGYKEAQWIITAIENFNPLSGIATKTTMLESRKCSSDFLDLLIYAGDMSVNPYLIL